MATVRNLSAHAPAWTCAWFCNAEHCPVVYFDDAGASIHKTEVRIGVFQKETDLSRLVC